MIMSGALFFHLFTLLGVVRVVDAAGNTDWACCSLWPAAYG